MPTSTVVAVPAQRVPHDPARLAAYLVEHDLPGARSKTAITRLRRQRAKNRPFTEGRRPGVAERAQARLLAEVVAEISRRGGETEILGEKGRVNARLAITDRDRAQNLVLVTCQGWRYYSSRFGARRASLAYLSGVDDAGRWAVRVPGTITTVAEALTYITPAEVTQAIQAGRRVRRQGDIYAIETTRAHDGRGADDLPEAHQWRPETRYLVHRPEDGRRHRPLRLPYPVRFVRQRVLGMGRGAGGSYGD